MRAYPSVARLFVLAALGALGALGACGDDARANIEPEPEPEPDPKPDCNPGFVLAGDVCVDVDECAGGLDNCDLHAACANTAGAFTCTCESGWIGDGASCELAPCRYQYTAGHGDMYTSWDATSGLVMALRSELEPGMGERAYPPLDVCIHVPHSTYEEIVSFGGRPPGAGWDPVGVAAGEPFWYLSETPIDGTPWFGIASDQSPAGGIPIGVFEQFMTLTLQVAGPTGAALSLWGSVDDPESPPFLFSTAIGLEEAEVITGSHAHMSWAFTRAGTYLVEATITGTRVDTREKVTSQPATYRFIVD